MQSPQLTFLQNELTKHAVCCAVACQQWSDIKGRVGVFELKVMYIEVSLEMPHESRCMHTLTHSDI